MIGIVFLLLLLAGFGWEISSQIRYPGQTGSARVAGGLTWAGVGNLLVTWGGTMASRVISKWRESQLAATPYEERYRIYDALRRQSERLMGFYRVYSRVLLPVSLALLVAAIYLAVRDRDPRRRRHRHNLYWQLLNGAGCLVFFVFIWMMDQISFWSV